MAKLKVKIDLFGLWNKAEAALGTDIEVEEVRDATGIASSTISRMKRGEPGRLDLDKFAAICEYLYKTSGMEITTNAPVPWLVFINEPDFSNEAGNHAS